MKSIVTLILILICGAGTLIGCEAREDTAPMPAPVPGDMAPGMMEESSTTAPGTAAPGTIEPSTQASAALAIVNQYCAVMSDNKVDPNVTTVHDGKTIGFCCEECIPTFKKDPAKYLASLK